MKKGMIWMPYYKVQFSYMRSGKVSIAPARMHGKTGRGKTALNAMFCGSVNSEDDIFMLFRPNYLKLKVTKRSPQSKETLGPIAHADFDEVFKGLLGRFNRVNDELHKLRSALSKSRLRLRRYSMIAPVLGGIKQNEGKLSEKVARLQATKSILSFCLNVNDSPNSIKVTGHSVFYYPTFVVGFKHKEDGSERYLIINLVKSGLISKHLSCDEGLAGLCNRNDMCKEILAKVLTSMRK